MKVGRDYSWWVDYSYSYDLFMEDEQTWENCVILMLIDSTAQRKI